MKDERDDRPMRSLTEIESDIEALTPDQKYTVNRFLEGRLEDASGGNPPINRRSVLDIPSVTLGTILRPLTDTDDLLGEMLEEQ